MSDLSSKPRPQAGQQPVPQPADPTPANPRPVHSKRPEITVFYDGGCGLCRREVAFYRRLDGAGRIGWTDVAAGDSGAACPLDRAAALARLHLQRADGSLASGAEAFVEIWRRLPGFRHLARLARLPGALRLLEAGYRGFLKIRPWLTGRPGG